MADAATSGGRAVRGDSGAAWRPPPAARQRRSTLPARAGRTRHDVRRAAPARRLRGAGAKRGHHQLGRDCAVVGEPVRDAVADKQRLPLAEPRGGARAVAHQRDGAGAHDRHLGSGMAVPLLRLAGGQHDGAHRVDGRTGGADGHPGVDGARRRLDGGRGGGSRRPGRRERGPRRARRPGAAAPAGRAARRRRGARLRRGAGRPPGPSGTGGGGHSHRSSCGSRRQEGNEGDPPDGAPPPRQA